MSVRPTEVTDASLATVLSSLAPSRVLLAGPVGPTLQAVLEWARREPGVAVRRQADAAGAVAGDLIVCESARTLAGLLDDRVVAFVPDTQTAAADGWAVTLRTRERQVLLRRPDAPPLALEPAGNASERLRSLGTHRQPELAAGTIRGPEIPRSAVGEELRGAAEVSIVIAVDNAGPELRRCLRSVMRHTTMPAELLLIDDASTDPEIAEILHEAAELSRVRILRNAAHSGFTATVNRALRATDRDIVLLKSDTQVGPRWLEHLAHVARSGPSVATVTAVTDNAGAFAVPIPGEQNPTPLGLDVTGVARLLAQRSISPVPAPTGSGFCLYITRAAIDALGDFDAEAFPHGYGEDDFCMRAVRAGWTHLIDGRTFVHHVGRASFGEERVRVEHMARARVNERYPEYGGLMRDFVGGRELAQLHSVVRAAYAEPDAPRPRILFLIDDGGGTSTANLELVRAIDAEWDPLLLSSDRKSLRLSRLIDGEQVALAKWTLDRPIRLTDFARRDYQELLRSMLTEHEIELIHIRHLVNHTFDPTRVAAQLGVPVVLSFDDFYFTSPTVNLLDETDGYGAAACTPGDGECRVPDGGLEGLPHLRHGYVQQWREEVQTMLRGVDAFVTSSEHARAEHRRALPAIGERPFVVIERGRLLHQRGGVSVPPRPDGPVRILVVADLDVPKGANYLRAMLAADRDQRLELHLLGSVPDGYANLGICHGQFDGPALPERAATIAPAFAGCFSIFPETYSHSLTEAWSMGVPVVATDIGVCAERIRAHGGGQLVPVDDPAEAVRRIYAVADDPDAYARMRSQATLRDAATVADMTDAYAALYREVLDERRALAVKPTGRGPAHLRRGVTRMLAVVPGAEGVHPGSTYVRIVQRYRHPAVSWKLSLALRYAGQDPLRAPAELALVQRTALDPAQTEWFLAGLHERELPLVLDLDDHLLIKGAADLDYGSHQDSLAALVDSASVLLVSTQRLAQALAGRAQRVELVPNLIDERLFLSGVSERPRGEHRGRALQIVYIGSPTHAVDLAMLRPVMARLHELHPGAFELNVVGAERPGRDQEWYRRVVVPDPCKPYPHFVRWLRGQRPHWDVAVAPLHDDEFNSYKSDLKHLEYAGLGLPAIFSDLEPYSTVEHGSTGLKVGNDIEQWCEALLMLRDDLALRDQLAENAFEYVISERLMRDGAERLLSLLCAI